MSRVLDEHEQKIMSERKQAEEILEEIIPLLTEDLAKKIPDGKCIIIPLTKNCELLFAYDYQANKVIRSFQQSILACDYQN